jgi:CheY-like chemotaxis protein
MPIKVLLVDDDDAFRVVTAIALESEGCVVREAADGYAALDALQTDRPDVIVSDLDMPGLDGVELCQRVRANPVLAQIQFVLLSALFESDGAGSPTHHQADCCLSKQLHFQQLYRHIESLARPGDDLLRSSQADS